MDSSSTLDLIDAARGGDELALQHLYNRYVPDLRRWASGRLPFWARDLNDTHDLVQETVVSVFRKLEAFEYRGEGTLRAYLRTSLMNRLRNEIRRASARPPGETLDTGIEDRGVSPIDATIAAEVQDRYEAALARLREDERDLIIGRVELGLTYAELAVHANRTSPDAARMGVVRALVRLSEEMERGGT